MTMDSTNYGLQVKLGNHQWVTYCGIWSVDSLTAARHKASSIPAPKDPRTGGYYRGYRVADLVGNRFLELQWEV
jgi:hypothetical protein